MEKIRIVCTSYTTWVGPYSSSIVQILSIISKKYQVLFIEYPFTIKDVILGFLGRKSSVPYKRILGIDNRVKNIKLRNGQTVEVAVLFPILPSDFLKNNILFKIVLKLNQAIYTYSLRRILKKKNLENFIHINSYNPYFGIPLVSKINQKSDIYYCCDAINTHRQKERAKKVDEIFSQIVNTVVVTSDKLLKNKSILNARTYLVKNGVDYCSFSKFSKSIPHDNLIKIVGYVGSIDERFDIDCIEYVLKNRKNYFFEFIGEIRNKEVFIRLSNYENVIFKPPVELDLVPEIMNRYDVGIIPYLRNEFTECVYPLKLNEYLAIGLPVVMMRFADLPEFANFVSIAESKEYFLLKLDMEISTDNLDKIRERKILAKNNSWEIRVEEFCNILNLNQ